MRLPGSPVRSGLDSRVVPAKAKNFEYTNRKTCNNLKSNTAAAALAFAWPSRRESQTLLIRRQRPFCFSPFWLVLCLCFWFPFPFATTTHSFLLLPVPFSPTATLSRLLLFLLCTPDSNNIAYTTLDSPPTPRPPFFPGFPPKWSI